MIGQTVVMALHAMRGSKIRTLLTMLGVIIGVLSVVVLIGVGQGATQSVTDSISGLGTNLLSVTIQNRSNARSSPGSNFAANASAQQRTGTVVLTLDQILALGEDESIQAISPLVSGSVTAKAGSTNASISAMGVLPAYAEIRKQVVESGRYIMQADVDNRSAVCVIGVETAETLFGNTNVVGNAMSINGRPFRIVGVLEKKGSSSSDNVLILPFTLAQRMLKSTNISSFSVSAVSPETVKAAQTVVESYLYKRYKNTNSYSVTNQAEALSMASDILGLLTSMLAGIAGISLLVGGIGIMNIMLVSVAERTREIGIRKAIGARRRDILLQFLIESVLISGAGGLVGMGLGYATMLLVERLLGIPAVFSPGVVQMALLFSMGVGVLFGSYPASKASKLKPIEALRYDG